MKSILIIVLLAYVGLCSLLYFFQRSILYFPQPAIGIKGADTFKISVKDISLSGWLVNPGQSRALLYYGGNAEIIEQNALQFQRLLSDYSIYFVPYRGYGNNAGTPDESKLYSDALAVFDQIKDKYESISVIGRSLGSGVATYIASEREVSKVALITPYDSIVSVAGTHYPLFPVSFLVNQRFLSIERANKIKSPTLIVIAQNDQVIPPKHSEALAVTFNQSVLTKVMIESASHNDVSNFEQFEEVLSQFFE